MTTRSPVKNGVGPLVLVKAPRTSFGNILWEPVNKLAVALLDLIDPGKENFSGSDLEKLEALGFMPEVVFPGQERGVDWKVTR